MGPIEILVVTFDGKHRAEQVLDVLKALDHKETLNILNAVVLRKDAGGNVTISNDGDLHAGGGALFGAFVGAIIGLLGGPGGAVVGAAAGAITGGITALGIDLGFSEEVVTVLQSSISPNASAILALVESDWVESFASEIKAQNGTIIRSELRDDIARRIRKERNKD